ALSAQSQNTFSDFAKFFKVAAVISSFCTLSFGNCKRFWFHDTLTATGFDKGVTPNSIIATAAAIANIVMRFILTGFYTRVIRAVSL
ncbi:MAG: hypothetical protein WA421_11210, partial [Nitrososphaeraceae archaeon]